MVHRIRHWKDIASLKKELFENSIIVFPINRKSGIFFFLVKAFLDVFEQDRLIFLPQK